MPSVQKWLLLKPMLPVKGDRANHHPIAEGTGIVLLSLSRGFLSASSPQYATGVSC